VVGQQALTNVRGTERSPASAQRFRHRADAGMNREQYLQKKGWRSPPVVRLEQAAPQVMQDERAPAAPPFGHSGLAEGPGQGRKRAAPVENRLRPAGPEISG
jgi:hypothetical protein